MSIIWSQKFTWKLERIVEIIIDKFAKNVESLIEFKQGNLRRPVFARGLKTSISPEKEAFLGPKTNDQVLKLYKDTGR